MSIYAGNSAPEVTGIRADGHATDAEATAACRVIRSTDKPPRAQDRMHGRYHNDERSDAHQGAASTDLQSANPLKCLGASSQSPLDLGKPAATDRLCTNSSSVVSKYWYGASTRAVP